MEFLLYIFLLPVPFAGNIADPGGGVWGSKVDARNMQCVRMSQRRAHELYPTVVLEPPARERVGETTDALVCQRTVMSEGDRPRRDEAILQALNRTVGELTEAASAKVPADHTLHIDAFYPQQSVAAKIAIAARTQLAERGRRVSDRVPLLAAGDVVVLARMPPEKAYPLACAQYFAEKALGEKDAFVGLMLLDARETQLHAGLCMGGEWTWLQ